MKNIKFFQKITFSNFSFYYLGFYKDQNRQNIKAAKANQIFSPLLAEVNNCYLPIFFKKKYWVLLPPSKTPNLLLIIGRKLGFFNFLFLFKKKDLNYKQSYLKNKSKISEQIYLDETTNLAFLQNKSLIILDDVMTSGWTVKTMIYYLKKTKILSKIKNLKIVILYKTIHKERHLNYISKAFLLSEE